VGVKPNEEILKTWETGININDAQPGSPGSEEETISPNALAFSLRSTLASTYVDGVYFRWLTLRVCKMEPMTMNGKRACH